MANVSRRGFIATGAVVLSGAPGLVKSAIAQPPRKRFNVLSAQGQAALIKYRQAVKLMKATGSGTPTNWVFQWYTHAVTGSSTKAAQLTAIYGPNPSPNKTLATQVWSTCQAHFNPANERFFLPWHRMFVFFLEKICQKVLNDNTFALPYWNYSSPNAAGIPQGFRLGNNPPNNPLFVQNRNAGVNNGNAIASPGALSAQTALSQMNYLPTSQAVRGFSETLDFGLHGNVHVGVGTQTNMGQIPFAANDPIFWMHHCNIDRLWASWNRCGRKNPTNDPSWMSKTFTFANENGQPVSPAVSGFDTITELGYTYDFFESVPHCGPIVLPSPAAAAEAKPTALVSSSGGPTAAAAASGIALGSGPVNVKLRPAPSAAAAAAPTAALGARVEQLPDTSRMYLLLKNLKASAQPGVLYHVYLDLPSGTSPAAAAGHYVGTINFFDAVPLPDHEGHAAAAAPADTAKIVSFDVTDVAQRLRAEGRLSDTPNVTIVPDKAPVAQAKPVIGEIEIVEQ